jgi:cytochrome c oxidase assembly protein subunit 15
MTSHHGRPLSATRAPQGTLGIYVLALLICAATLVLLAAGALVVGTGSSLAVPDWPLAYGQFFPPMVGGILFEHGHRMVASAVGLLTVILALWLARREPRRWVRRLGFGAMAVVVVQGLLGGITVLLLLPKAVSISHAILAQTFFVMAVLLAQVTAPGWPAFAAGTGRAEPGSVRWLGIITLAALEGELLLGAMVRHYNAGLVIPDFPLALGQVLPPLESFPVAIHFLHRVGALVVLGLVVATGWMALARHGADAALKRRVGFMAATLLAQVVLGAFVIWSQRQLAVTTLHVNNWGHLAGATALVTLRAWILEDPSSASLDSLSRAAL